MANVKISNLTAATTPLAGTEVLPIVQSGATVKASIANVQTAVYPGGTANGVAYLNGSKVLTTGSALVFDGSNLGVGVTPSAWTTLTAIQNKNSSWYGFGNEGGLYANAYYASGSWRYIATAAATGYDSNGAAGQHRWYNAPSGTAGNAITFTQAMTLDASGNLAIGGTSSFGARLYAGSANGTTYGSTAQLRLSGRSANNLASILFTDDNTSDGRISYAPNTTAASRYFSFSARGTESDMILDASGNLLVGTTSTLGSTAGILVANSGANVQAITTNSTSSSSYYIGRFYSGGTEKGYIYFDGTNVSYTNLSDYRLKENVQPMQNALDKVAQLNPVTYSWKSNGKAGQGFIAHELQAVVPDCVTGDKDAVDEDGNPKYQGVDTSFLVATLTAAIQEQQALITQLTARITALESA